MVALVNVAAPKLYTIPLEARKTVCWSCRAVIVFITTDKKKQCPVDAEGPTRGQSHFTTCPSRDLHKKGQA